jgi:hypothetical protein
MGSTKKQKEMAFAASPYASLSSHDISVSVIDCHVRENFKHFCEKTTVDSTCVDDETVLLMGIQEPVVQRHVLVHDRPEVLPAIYVISA